MSPFTPTENPRLVYSNLTTGAATTLPAGELIFSADANLGGLHKQPGNPLIQFCGGQHALTEERVFDGPVVGGSSLRLGSVANPLDSTRKCWLLRVASTDADTFGTGAKRAEIVQDDGTGIGPRYILGLSTLIDNWAALTDEVSIWQTHNDDEISAPVPLICTVKGSLLRITLGYCTTLGDTKNVRTTIYTGTVAAGAFDDWVIEWQRGDTQNGYLNIWRNGAQIVKHVGRMWSPVARSGDYFKAGIYHWQDSNPWDSSMPVRQMWLKGPYVFRGDAVMASDIGKLLQAS